MSPAEATNSALSAHHASIFLHGLERAKDIETIRLLSIRHGDWLMGIDVPRLNAAYLDAIARVQAEEDEKCA